MSNETNKVSESERQLCKMLETKLRDKTTKKKVDDLMLDTPKRQDLTERKRAMTATKEEQSEYLQNCLDIVDFPPVDFKSPEDVQRNVRMYLELCIERGSKTNLPALALALGIDRNQFNNYLEDTCTKTTPETRAIMKRAKAVLNVQHEEYMQNGKMHPACAIFLGKNNYGYVDEVKQTITHNNLLGNEGNEDDMKKKYGDTIIDAEFEPK